MAKACPHEKDEKRKKVFYWEYDDKTVGHMLFGHKGRKSQKFGTVDSKEELKKHYGKDKEKRPKLKELSILGGIDQNSWDIFESISIDCDAMADGLSELKKMLAAYTKSENEQTVWDLFSYITAGYIARYLNHKTGSQSLYFHRAPIVQLVGHKKEACAGFEYVERIVESLSVDTSRSGKLVMENPSVIPSARPVDKIIDCAYMVYDNDKKERPAPTQYRDTAVLLHPYFFDKKDWEDFIHRNRWATILVFNEKLSDKFQLVQRVDLNKLNLPDWDWDIDKVNCLIQKYVQWLSYIQRAEHYKKRWVIWTNVAVNVLFHYELANAKKGIKRIQGSERKLKILQIASIFSLLDYCYLNEIIDAPTRDSMCKVWFGNLLGCSNCFPERINKIEERCEREQDENERLLWEFKQLIKYILEEEDCRYVKYVPEGGYCGDSDVLDVKNGPWAYLYMQRIGKTKNQFRAIKIRKDVMIELGERTGLLSKGTLVGRVKKKCISHNEPDKPFDPDDVTFIHSFNTARFKFKKYFVISHENSIEGVVLYLDKLDFLEPVKWEKLKSMFPDKE